jgi:sugar fermentation stimulation protein A
MKFGTPLLPARFLRRYKRFFADVELPDRGVVTVHVPNTGSLAGCLEPGAEAYVSGSSNPKRKLAYTLELLRVGSAWVGVNPIRANALAEEAVRSGVIAELSGFASIRREVRYGVNSRIDLLLQGDGRPECYVEVKSVTLGRGSLALFPDAVSERASKHMAELLREAAAGARACVLFVVQRADCTAFAPADDVDPAYGRALREAVRGGVDVLAYRATAGPDGIAVDCPLPIQL